MRQFLIPALLVIAVLSSCSKEERNLRRLEGTWEVTELKTHSLWITGGGDLFHFNECHHRDLKRSAVRCKGTFTSNYGKEEFEYEVVKNNTFILYPLGSNGHISKYCQTWSIQKESTKTKMILKGQRSLTLDRDLFIIKKIN